MDEEEDLLIVTDDEIMNVGLSLMRYSDEKIGRVDIKENLLRFCSLFGLTPIACAQLWEALQVTDLEDARVEGTLAQLEKYLRLFLMALHWLKCYPTEAQREALFQLNPKTCREWGWYFVDKIAALQEEKVRNECGISPLPCFYSIISPNSRSFSLLNGSTTRRRRLS